MSGHDNNFVELLLGCNNRKKSLNNKNNLICFLVYCTQTVVSILKSMLICLYMGKEFSKRERTLVNCFGNIVCIHKDSIFTLSTLDFIVFTLMLN
jgi:hypothetical protein